MSPWSQSTLQPSQHVLLPPASLPRWCLLSQSGWADPHASHHRGWSTGTRWEIGPSLDWWSSCGRGCSTGSPEWWTDLKDAYQWPGTPEPDMISSLSVTINLVCILSADWLWHLWCCYLERMRQQIRRQLSEAAAGNDLIVAIIQKEDLQKDETPGW